MIRRLGRYKWEVTWCDRIQTLIGTRSDAKKLEQSMAEARARTVEEARAKQWRAKAKFNAAL